MRVLFIGGTGTISRACARRCVETGIELWQLVRGTRDARLVPGAQTVRGDLRKDDPSVISWLAGQNWDVVVDWVVYNAQDVERDLRLFTGKTKRFVYVSSTSVYSKPPSGPVVDEAHPIGNPLWKYADGKARCERLFDEAAKKGFPLLTVRPGHVYAEFACPSGFVALAHGTMERILEGQPLVVHGDGLSWWSLMDSEDFARRFVPLLSLPGLEGQKVQITSEEFMTWTEIYQTMGRVLGREPRLVRVPSEHIARFDADLGETLLGDKAFSIRFDNTKIRALVPDAPPPIPFEEGFRRCADWYRKNRSEVVYDKQRSVLMDEIVRWHDSCRPEDRGRAEVRTGYVDGRRV